ncbi:MAG: HWE histidine kinase domain-containing protein [Sphingomonadaceae bacterium]
MLAGSYGLLLTAIDSSLEEIQLLKAVRGESGDIIDFEWLLTNKRWNERWGSNVGRRLLNENPGVLETGLWNKFVQVTETGVPITHEQYYNHEQFDGWFHQTIAKANDGILLSSLDISNQKLAEIALRESKERYAALFASSPAPFLILNPDAPRFTIADVNDAYLTATMRCRDDLVGCAMFEAFPDNPSDPAADGVKNLRASLERVLVTRQFDLMEVQRYAIIRPDGIFEERWWQPANAPVLDGNGNVVAIIHHVADVTERHASDERQKLLLAELQHRVRNILAMVRSMVRQTSSTYEYLEEFTAHLVGRLDAMARTQVLLTRSADSQVHLEHLVHVELDAHLADEARVEVKGPNVRLSSKAAEVLTLALHELATNSIKYGALAEPGGALSVTWAVAPLDGENWLQLEWQEQSMQTICQGDKSGFGTELIEQRVPYELHGEGTLYVTASGVRAEIAFPLIDGTSVFETGPDRGGAT